MLEQAKGQAFDRSDGTHVEAVRGRRASIASCRDEKLFVGARYNQASRRARRRHRRRRAPIAGEFGGGWFITPNVLAKAEYVNQKYFGYPDDQHQERRAVQRLHARRRHRLLDGKRGPVTMSSQRTRHLTGRRTHTAPAGCLCRGSDSARAAAQPPRLPTDADAGGDRPRGGLASTASARRSACRNRRRRPSRSSPTTNTSRASCPTSAPAACSSAVPPDCRRAGSRRADDDVLEAHSPGPRGQSRPPARFASAIAAARASALYEGGWTLTSAGDRPDDDRISC